MRRAAFHLPGLALALVGLAACGDTDVANRGDDVQPGQEIEDSGVELDVDPVDLEAQRWFREGGTVEFGNRTWILAGEPIYDPAVEYVGEYEGTPLYADVNTAQPYRELFIPLEHDYWQMLQPTQQPGETETFEAPMQELPGEVPEAAPGGATGGGGGD